MTITVRDAYRKGARSRGTAADWDDALLRFTRRYCAHAEYAAMCDLCHAWCDGFSGIELGERSLPGDLADDDGAESADDLARLDDGDAAVLAELQSRAAAGDAEAIATLDHVAAIMRGDAWITEAECARCGETFIPHSLRASDLIHGEREDGSPCGGTGAIRGYWGPKR